MRRASALLVIALVGFVTLPAVGQNSAESTIRQAVQKYVVAFNAGDFDAAASTYAPDATHTYAFGLTHRGRGQIASGLRELLAGPMKGAKISISTLDIRFLSPTIALEEEAFSVEGLRLTDGQPAPVVKGLCLAVHQRIDQQWLAAAVQCLVPPPQPPGT